MAKKYRSEALKALHETMQGEVPAGAVFEVAGPSAEEGP